MAKVSVHLHHFLQSQIEEKPYQADLLQRVLERGTDLELQVNVRKDVGEPVDKKQNTYTDGIDTWFAFRIPKNAYDVPEWEDYNLQWSLAKYIDCLGSTGWCWTRQESLWVGYDFDAIIGHAEGRGIGKDDLERVQAAVAEVPWVEVRRSTGGGGLHLYVPLQGIYTNNHTEHAAVGRAVLSILADEVNFDFANKVDVCGGNMWVWARRATEENQGLALIKPATERFSSLPSNWREHIDVVSRRRTSLPVKGITPDRENIFTQLASAYRRVKLDDTHKKIMSELEAQSEYETSWVRDHYLLQTHTLALKAIAPNYKGIFETASRGSTTCNCFMFPAENGSWRVYRFGAGTSEAPTWDHGSNGWTSCWFNKEPDLKVSANAYGASQLKNGGYEFTTLKMAMEVAKTLSSNVNLQTPSYFEHRKAIMDESSAGTILIQVPKEEGDIQPPGWNSVDKKGYWTSILQTTNKTIVPADSDYDSVIRCLTTPQSQPAGWATITDDGKWVRKSAASVKTILQYMGHSKTEAEQIMGRAEYRPWKMVCLPFEEEYPGDRQWNLDSPQLEYTPSPEPGEHSHWDMMLDHIGESLGNKLSVETWAASGREYLQGWLASLIRYPHERLPYLFLYGPQNSGKSILHEAFDLLVTGGVVKADHALTSSNDFNGELERAILCVVEEKDIASVKGAYAKIKEVITALKLAIRRMRTDVYMVKNYTHWIQCANTSAALSMLGDDTRITVLYVDKLTHEIPKHIFLQRLREEASAFLRTLFDFRLPPWSSRLRIPMVATDDKAHAIEMQKTFLDMFLDDMTEECEGVCEVTFREFFELFQSWLPSGERWSKIRVSKALPVKYKIEPGPNNKRYVRGIQWKSKTF